MREEIWTVAQYWIALFFFFALQYVIQLRFTHHFKQRRALTAGIIVLGFSIAGVILWARNQDSLYREFGIRRCASYNEVGSRFKFWSKNLHPDIARNLRSATTFERISFLKEKLASSAFRLFYDKFDLAADMDLEDIPKISAFYRYKIQSALTDYMRTLFFWVFALFAAAKLRNNFSTINHMLKLVMAKSFVVAYYLFAQEIYRCSPVDILLPQIGIQRQIYFIEFIFASTVAFIWPLVEKYVEEQTRQTNSQVALLAASSVITGNASLQKLRETLQKYINTFRLAIPFNRKT